MPVRTGYSTFSKFTLETLPFAMGRGVGGDLCTEAPHKLPIVLATMHGPSMVQTELQPEQLLELRTGCVPSWVSLPAWHLTMMSPLGTSHPIFLRSFYGQIASSVESMQWKENPLQSLCLHLLFWSTAPRNLAQGSLCVPVNLPAASHMVAPAQTHSTNESSVPHQWQPVSNCLSQAACFRISCCITI